MVLQAMAYCLNVITFSLFLFVILLIVVSFYCQKRASPACIQPIGVTFAEELCSK